VVTSWKHKEGTQQLSQRRALAQKHVRLSSLAAVDPATIPGIENLNWEYGDAAEDPAVGEAALAASPPAYVFEKNWGWYSQPPVAQAVAA